jgi:hypothetical protein
MPVDECLRQYEVFGKQIFGCPRKFSVKGVPRDKYSSKPLVNALKTLTMAKTPERSKQDSANEPAGRLRRPKTFHSAKSTKNSEKSKSVTEQKQKSTFSTFRSPEDLCKM